MKKLLLWSIASGLVFFACKPQDASENVDGNSNAVPVSLHASDDMPPLDNYWYQGKAELSRYELSQNRYKDNHPGSVVMVFVTEDFLTDKQVKNDHYTNPNSIPILKNNIVKEFTTGIYAYHIMTSVFTPVQADKYPATLKVSNSAQEWCGQTYMQINYNQKKKAYDYLLHSYFENEADQEGQVKGALLEEELFNRIRMSPQHLPLGQLQLLPSAEYSRLTHRRYEPITAEASLQDYAGTEFEGTGLQVYSLHYPELQRTLDIVFEAETPYRIAGWKDTYPSMFDQQPRITLAKRTHTIMDDYWKHNALADTDKRATLGLD